MYLQHLLHHHGHPVLPEQVQLNQELTVHQPYLHTLVSEPTGRGLMNLRLFQLHMSTSFRVLMIDLLVERAEFGHGGNQEVIRPMAALSDIEVLLITPQMQSFEAGSKIQSNADVQLEEIDVPNWDNEYEFWGQTEVELEGRKINFKRIIK